MTTDRQDAIIRLLRTRDEHLPEPIHRTEAAAGFVHRAPARISCPDCLANGNPMFGCETCGGRGYTEEHRERDPYAIDAVVPYGLGPDRGEATRSRDRQIDVLEQQLRPASKVDELADANAHPYAWETARRQMYKLFDYAALDLVLEQLRVRDDGASRALHAVYVYGWQPDPTPGPLQEACERGLAFLDEHLPGPDNGTWRRRLRAPAPPRPLEVRGPLRPEAGAVAKAVRDGELRERARAGASPAELAAEFRVSIRTVYDAVRAT